MTDKLLKLNMEIGEAMLTLTVKCVRACVRVCVCVCVCVCV